MITSWEDERLAELRKRFGNFDLWTVRVATERKTIWCARPTGTEVATINSWDLAEFVRALCAAEPYEGSKRQQDDLAGKNLPTAHNGGRERDRPRRIR